MAQTNRLFCKAPGQTNGGFEEDKQMKLKEAIQSANLHASTSHARAKADAVEGKTEQPRPTLTFDGCGINGPDEYRSRLATFTSREEGKRWGPLLAAAPEMLEALESCLGPIQDEYNRAAHAGHATRASVAFLKAKQAILKAKGSL